MFFHRDVFFGGDGAIFCGEEILNWSKKGTPRPWATPPKNSIFGFWPRPTKKKVGQPPTPVCPLSDPGMSACWPRYVRLLTQPNFPVTRFFWSEELLEIFGAFPFFKHFRWFSALTFHPFQASHFPLFQKAESSYVNMPHIFQINPRKASWTRNALPHWITTLKFRLPQNVSIPH